MRRRTAALLIALSAILAVGIPTFAALRLAHTQAVSAERERSLGYAREVLRRTVALADEADRAIIAVNKTFIAGRAECSPAALELMQRTVASANYIETIGVVRGDSLLCDALHDTEDVGLGPVDVITPFGAKVRANVRLPFAPGVPSVVLERDHVAVVVNRSLALDVSGDPHAVLAIVTAPKGHPVVVRGTLPEDWVARGLTDYASDALQPVALTRTFFDEGFLVAVVTSESRFAGAIAAVPTGGIASRTRHAAIVLMPIGGVAGLLLALTVIYFVRTHLALPAVLRSALRRREFHLVYQPIVDLRTGTWFGAEALIRWRRPHGPPIGPDVFVPIAENGGLSNRLTAEVL